MDLQATITLFMTVLGFALKPGPGLTTIMSRTMAQGMPGCFAFMAGFCLVMTFYLSLLFAGLKFAEDDVMFISIFLKAITSVYLIYLGIKGLLNPDVQISMYEDKEIKLFDTFLAGLMVTAANPLVIVFYGVLLPSIVPIAGMGINDMVIVIMIVLFVETAGAMAYALPVAYARSIITPKFLRVASLVASTVILVVGLVIAWSAMPAKDLLLLGGGQ